MESRASFLVWFESDGTKAARAAGVRTEEPHKNIDSLPTFHECREALAKFDPSSMDEEKSLRKALRSKLDSFASMCTRVSEQSSRLAFAVKRFNERFDAKVTKDSEEAAAAEKEKDKSKGQKARMAVQVAGAPKKKEVYAILQHVTKMVKMRRLKDAEEWGDFKYQDLPVILHSPMPESLSGLILQSQETSEFKKLAENSARYRTSGRVTQQLDSVEKDLADFVKAFRTANHTSVLNLLSNAEKGYLELPWMFLNSGSKQCRGAEFSYLPTLKYQLAGSRVVLACDFAMLLAYVKTTQPANMSLTYDQVVDFFAEADRYITCCMYGFVIALVVIDLIRWTSCLIRTSWRV